MVNLKTDLHPENALPVAANESGTGNDLDNIKTGSIDPGRRAIIEQVLKDLDINDPRSILFFGSKAQERLTEIADNMLEGVRNKDTGNAGLTLNSMLSVLRGFDTDALDPTKKQSLFKKIFGVGKPIAKFLQDYEKVSSQIDTIGDRLDQHKSQLLADIIALDRLYEANLSYFHDLANYIIAGEEKLKELDQQIIPAVNKQIAVSNNALASQNLRDIQEVRNNLERRVHELKLTRQVAMQALPSIRLIQENDKGLVNKITSVLVNTVPLWRQKLAQAVTIYRSREAGAVLKQATDLTNQLLESNAETLRQANAEVRRQIERSVFDIDSVKKANDLLIATIEDSLQIADEGKKRRAEAERQLHACENDLRKTLLVAQN